VIDQTQVNIVLGNSLVYRYDCDDYYDYYTINIVAIVIVVAIIIITIILFKSYTMPYTLLNSDLYILLFK